MKLNRRGFIGSVTALAVGAVAAVKAKPKASSLKRYDGFTGPSFGTHSRVPVGQLNEDWARWFQSIAKAAAEHKG